MLTAALWRRHSRLAIHTVTDRLRSEVGARVQASLATYLRGPRRATETIRAACADGRVRLDDRAAVQRLLWDTLRTFDEAAYVQVGYPGGGFVGAERRLDGRIRFQATAGPAAGDLTDFDVGPDGRVTASREGTAGYDARTRPWYRAARSAGGPTWTPIYAWIGDPPRIGITAVEPLTDDAGALRAVVGCDIELAGFDRHLKAIQLGPGGRVFVIDRAGLLVARATRAALRVDADGRPLRVAASDCRDAVVRRIAALLGGPTDRLRRDVGPVGERLLVDVAPLAAPAGLDWRIVVAVAEADFAGPIARSGRATLWLWLAALLITLVAGGLLTRRVTRTLARLVADMRRVASFELQPAADASSRLTELAAIEDAMARMKRGLRSFERYVPADVVRQLIRANREATPGLAPTDVTLLFCDLAGFTSLAERLAPDVLVELVGAYLARFSAEIAATGGTVDKFIGDAVMAFWNAPEPVAGHASAACDAALACAQALDAMNVDWQARGLPRLDCRIGLHSGRPLVGNLGSTTRLSYTAVGDDVNLAARLEGLNKRYGTQILISQAVLDQLPAGRHVTRPIDRVIVRGRREATTVHELIDRAASAPADLAARAQRHADAFAAYLERRFDEAAAAFSAGDDAVSERLAERCRCLADAPPPAGWDGCDVSG